MDKYPTDLSGGQKQRAVLARAIILSPDVLVADEPVSMLDMSVRAKILELMIDLKDELDLTYVYITHDLATAKFFCDRIAIMYLGRIVEIGPAEEIYEDPKHPYTVSLLRAIPEPDPRRERPPRPAPRARSPTPSRRRWAAASTPAARSAFEVCGWESRDLRTLLEDRWTRLGEEEYEAERELIGDLDSLDDPATVAPARGGARPRRRAGHGRDRAPARRGAGRSLLAGRRGDADRAAPGRGALPRRPRARDVEVGHSRLQCHLYDDEALARAKQAAAGET